MIDGRDTDTHTSTHTHVVYTRTSLRVKASPVMRSVQFLRLMLSSSTASQAYTFPDGFTATTLEWSVNSCQYVNGNGESSQLHL